MSLQDPFAGSDHDATRRVRWSWLSRWLGLPEAKRSGRGLGAPGRSRPSLRARVRDRRRLAAIERALAAEAPGLSSKFALFNQLTVGERPAGPEQLPPPRRPALRPAYLAVLLALAAVAALCVTLSLQLHPVVRTCAATATAAVRTSARAPMQDVACHAYATNK